MAITGSNRGTGSHNTSALSFTLSPTSNLASGSWAVLCLAVDNADSSGAAHSTFTVTDTHGNTWTRRTTPLYDPGAASAGVEGAIFTTDMSNGTLTTGSTITVTFDANTTAKVWTLMEAVPTGGSTITYVTGGNNTGAATGTPTVTTPSITSGNMVVGCGHAENTNSWTGDADTTNGSWSTQQTAGVGSTTSAVSITSQYKVVTATATQTYNPTRTSSDCILSYIVLSEIVAYTLACDNGSFALTGTAAALLRGRMVAADNGSFALAGTVAALLYGRKVDAGSGSFAHSGTAATLTYGRVVNADAGSFAMTGTAAALLYGRKLNADNGSFTLAGQDATLTYESGYELAADGGSFALSGSAAALLHGRRLNADGTSFALTGTAAALSVSRTIAANNGSFALTGAAVELRYGRKVDAGSGSFAHSGTAAALSRTRYLSAQGGSFDFTGQAADLEYSGGSGAAGEGPGTSIGLTIGIRIG